MHKILKEHIGDIKVLLILIAMLISIAAGEVAVLAACLALSACVDEIRIQILFKERKQLTNMIKELLLSSDTQTGEIEKLQGLSQKVKSAVSNQTGEIEKLQELNQEVKGAVSNQTGEIEKLQGLSQKVKGAVSNQTGKIEKLRELNQEVKGAVSNQTGKIEKLQELSQEVKYDVKTLILATGGGMFITIIFGFLGLFSDTFFNLLVEIHKWFKSVG